MKNIKYLLLAILSCFLMMTNVYAKESIEIKSITLDTKSENTVINSEPTFSGLEMNYDLTFKQVNDYAKYKIVIENNTNKDYKVTENKSFSISEYVTYKYESSQILKANETSTLYVIITYNKEVDSSLLVEGKYKETNKAVLQMTDENNVPAENPKTGVSNALLLLSLVGVLSVCIVVMINRQQKSITLVILLAVYLVPMITKAIEELKLTINVNVEIQKVEETPVTPDPPAQTYEVGYWTGGAKILLTDEELENAIRSSGTNCDVVYVGDAKYNYCNNLIIKDETRYAEGQTAPLKALNYKYIELWNAGIQQADESYLFSDQNIIETYTTKNWQYYSTGGFNQFTSDITDKAIMNFSNYLFDQWDSYGNFGVEAPQTFTMPGHNVLFTEMDAPV